jgi:hypothetical protein
MTDKHPKRPRDPTARFKVTHYPDASFQRADTPRQPSPRPSKETAPAHGGALRPLVSKLRLGADLGVSLPADVLALIGTTPRIVPAI